MGERIIYEADLSTIENTLRVIGSNLDTVNSNINYLDQHVSKVDDNLAALTRDLHQFIQYQYLTNNLQRAKTDLIEVRQTLERQFGHYELVRRTATGILQADDLGIVRKETISTATEELMLSTPGYWLAPCLVALAAWISDQPELAEKALREGIRRNDMKTSLFFSLVCRRADRKGACMKWVQRYLANQNEENLERTAVIILDAYANGLFGADADGLVSKQMNQWLEHLSEKPGFVEKQTTQWSDAINAKRMPVNTSSYTYLKQYTPTWPVMKDVLEGAALHQRILSYFSAIFEQDVSSDSLKVQLDGILNSLVTDFDDEELPLRKQEKLDMLIVQFEGDEERAKSNMAMEQSSFETHKDFTQLLTDAAMNAEDAHSSVPTQKLAIALSRDWINTAYADIIAKNRMKIPYEIEFVMDTFHDKTTDGTNENEWIAKFQGEVNAEKEQALESCKLTGFEQFCLYGGGALIAISLGMLMGGSTFMGLIAIVAGIGCISNHFTKKKQVEEARKKIEEQFTAKLESGIQIIRAFLAEVVDFRAEFAEKDSESQKVLDFLEQISPEQYVKRLSGTNRKIRLDGAR